MPSAGRTTSTGSHLLPFTIDLPPEDWALLPASRAGAWQIPAAAQGIQTIAGTIGSLPLLRYREVLDDAGVVIRYDPLPLPSLLRQLDPLEPAVVTLTALVEDLVLFPAAYLLVLDRDAGGWPTEARYCPSEFIEPRSRNGRDGYQVDGWPMPAMGGEVWPSTGSQWWAADDVIKFVSHWPGLLTAGARALRTSAGLETAAQRYANDDAPRAALKNRGADLPGDKVDELLSLFETARRHRTTAYLNAELDYQQLTWDAGAIQLVEGRQWQTSEIGRLLNLPPRYLNAPAGDSMTYATIESSRRDLVDLALRPYLATVEARLSLGDVTPRGQVVRYDLTDFYRADFSTLIDTYAKALAAGILTVDEVRAAMKLNPAGGR